MKRKQRLAIRAWRVVHLEGGKGILVYCDPRTEHLQLYEGGWDEADLVGPPQPVDRLEAEVAGYVQMLLDLSGEGDVDD